MPDFPRLNTLPLFISTFSLYSVATDAFAGATTTSVGSMNWPAQNLAIYIPVFLPFDYPVQRVFWANGSAAGGNMDFGIYTSGGARIVSAGATAATGNSTNQYVDVTDFTLSAGLYYFALVNDSATTTNRAVGGTGIATQEGRMAGMFQQASASPLPNPATFAAWASTGYPLYGITRTASGF